MITVNNATITDDAVAREAQYHPAPSREEALRLASIALVVRELLLQEAAAQGLGDATDAEGSAEEIIGALLERVIEVKEPGEEEARRYYESNRDRFRSPDIYEASHILFAFAPADPSGEESALAAARATLEELERDPRSFERLAEEGSADSVTRERGGQLGQMTRGQLPAALQACLDSLAPGELCREPVRTDRGYHVVRLDRAARGRQLSFDMSRERIAERLGARAWSAAARRYIASLADRAEIRGIELGSAVSMEPVEAGAGPLLPGAPEGR